MAESELVYPRAGAALATLGKRHGGHHHDGEEETESHRDSVRQHALAEAFWYTLIILVIVGAILRVARAWVAHQRLKRREAGTSSGAKASLLERFLYLLSEDSWRRRLPHWLPVSIPLRKILAILAYSAFVSFLITWKAVKYDDRFYERLGFRAAWITTTQTTLPFILAARTNPVGLLLGISYNRVNWMHRWASRVFFGSVTVHAAFFITEWLQANFFWEELRTVSMVKWGIAAWFVLLWTLVSSLVPVRRWRYEFFVVQHILSAVALLGFLFLHVPQYHHFSVWCATVAFLYDVVTRSANPIWRNLKLGNRVARVPQYAYAAKAEAVDRDLTMVTIQGVKFKWTPGQHVLIWTPSLRRQSPHPFTIIGAPDPSKPMQDIQLLMKTKTGFTRKMNDWARHRGDWGQYGEMRVLLAGPYGTVPNWRQYDNLVLISSSTGGSFTTSVLEALLASQQNPGCLRRITSVYVVRQKSHVSAYMKRLARALPLAKELGIDVRVELSVTGNQTGSADLGRIAEANGSQERLMAGEEGEEGEQLADLTRLSTDSRESTTSTIKSEEEEDEDDDDEELAILKEEMGLEAGPNRNYEDISMILDTKLIQETTGRPNIDALIRREVDKTVGRVMVAVCGGAAIEGAVQKSVASIERSEGVGDGDKDREISLYIERAAA